MPKIGFRHKQESKDKIKESCKKSYNPTKIKPGQHLSPSTEFKKGNISLRKGIKEVKLPDGSWYPKIPTLCACGCNEVVYNGKIYTKGHWIRKNINTFKKPHSKKRILKNSESHKGLPSPLKGKKGRLNKNYGRTRKVSYGNRYYYKSPLQGEVCLKMSYEYNYACYLDSIGEPWYYEQISFPIIFENEDTTYIPDFYLPRLNKFIEIKGWMRSKAQQKINKFKENYSYFLEILFYEDLKKLGIKFNSFETKKINKFKEQQETSYEFSLNLFKL